MKKVVVFTMLLFTATNSFCQKKNAGEPLSRQDYLVKSKNQKTAAWVLLGGGAVLIGTGLLIGDRKESSFDDAATGGIIGIAGALSMITSIPLFIASGLNKRKAMDVSAYLEIRRNPAQTLTAGSFRSYPTFSLQLNF
jgi:hypothetical protein